MRKRTIFYLAAATVCLCACSGHGKNPSEDILDYDMLNRQAAQEYLVPIRPGYTGENEFWNAYSTKFIYAPAFDFKAVEGAVKYRYTVTAVTPEEGQPPCWSFTADAPNLALSPIWNDIPVGKVKLVVEALDAQDKATVVGEREFLRDFPFRGPYHAKVRPYREAAIMALKYIHEMKQVQSWLTCGEPDLSYGLNSYVCKTLGSLLMCECMYSDLAPRHKEEALRIAESAAGFIMRVSRPAGDPLAYFPPTYYKNQFEACTYEENQGMTMSMEACKVAEGMLDLFDRTGKEVYFNYVRGILDTYARIQAEDGSIPMKLNFATGEAFNEVCARPHLLLELIRRMERQYSVTDYDAMRLKCETWMEENALKKFEMVGQFEDILVAGVKPFQNMTHWTCVPYAIYILQKDQPSAEDIALARDLIAFGEDQFAFWDCLPGPDGIRERGTPGVAEQYFYYVLVEDSATGMAKAWMAYYQATGDRLALAKARAMLDNVTIQQHANTGMIPTVWELGTESYWLSCNRGAIQALLTMSKLTGE